MRPASIERGSKSVLVAPPADKRNSPVRRSDAENQLHVRSRNARIPGNQLHGNGLCETGCNFPSAYRENRNGSSKRLVSPQISAATSLPTPIIL